MKPENRQGGNLVRNIFGVLNSFMLRKETTIDYKEIPNELLSTVGHLLYQGRVARKLSLPQAAELVGISNESLKAFEGGQLPMTTVHAQFIIAKYGGVRGDVLDSLIWRLTTEKLRCEQQTRERKHLSIVSENPRPWECIQFTSVVKEV